MSEQYDHSKYSISLLMTFNFEKGGGLTAKEIASRTGEDTDFDERVVQVSPKRFKEIINAYIKKAIKEDKAEKGRLRIQGNKAFKDTNDYYLANHRITEITIEALEYGSFRVPGEKDSWDKANEAYKVLMRYLIDNDQSSAQILDGIRIKQPKETLTLVEFIDSKKEEVREAFSSYRQEKYKDERFNRIFSHIRDGIKTQYEKFTRDEARRIKKEEPLLSTTQKINLLTENMNKQTEQQTKATENIGNIFKEKALYAHTLTQKHNFFHKI